MLVVKKIFKILGIFVLFLCLVLGVSIGIITYKLKDGEMSLNFVSSYIDDVVNIDGFKFSAEDSFLKILSNKEYPVQINIKKIRFAKGKDIEGYIDSLVLEYSWKNILDLNKTPSALTIEKSSIKRFGQADVNIKNDTDIVYQAKELFSLKDFTIQKFKIKNLEYESYDISDKLKFKFDIDTTEFHRLKNDVFEFKSSFKMESNIFLVETSIDSMYNIKEGSVLTKIRYKNANPSKFSSTIFDFVPILKQLNSTTYGEMLIRLDNLGDRAKKLHEHVKSIDFKVYGKKGEFVLGKDVFKFDDLALNLKSSDALDKIIINKSEVNYKNAKAIVNGYISGIDEYLKSKNNQALKMFFHAEAQDLQFDKLTDYWPSVISPEVKDWIHENMNGGMISAANFDLSYKGVNNESIFEPESIEGIAKIYGVSVDYLDGMPKVENADGSVNVSLKKVDIIIDKGNTYDLEVKSGTISFYDLEKEIANAKIRLSLAGKIKDALLIADSKPLEFIKAMGLNAKHSGGDTLFNLDLDFPMKEDLTIDEVTVMINGTAKDFSLLIKDEVAVNDGKIVFDINNMRANINGDVKINDDSAKIETVMNFSKNREFYQKHKVNIWHTDKDLQKIMGKIKGISDLKGLLKTDLTLTYKDENSGKFEALLDMSDISFTALMIGIKKDIGKKANLLVMGEFNSLGIVGDVDFAYKSSSSMITGKAKFNKKTAKLESVELSQIKSLKTNMVAKISFDKDDNPTVDVSGKEMNLAYFINADSKNDTETKDFKAKIEVAKVWVSDHGSMDQFYLNIIKQKGEYKKIDFSAITNEQHNPKDVSFSLDKRVIKAKTGSLGAVLKRLFVNPPIGLGRAELFAKIDMNGDIKGNLKVFDFIFKDSSISAKILLAASLTGIANALSPGIDFSKLDVPFVVENKVIKIEKGTASNSSIGITINGNIDTDNKKVMIEGAIIPIFWANGLLGKLPVLGMVFSGEKGGGIFGINYYVTGAFGDVAFDTNPFSLFAPGAFRTMFKDMSEPDSKKQKNLKK